ncbi:hypothetical protein BS47DRAFT_1395401 [Hydnum rufescens UP504]|uniref:Uncharacterized protein n=1 Tax=Hydnum rufescens UP504 TaxID=1448309 RepID=A0A9P6DU05_9AGAM|nr:hypothetical protein BS47DRAFT_1395401 [Hydnum rufescens UP504]
MQVTPLSDSTNISDDIDHPENTNFDQDDDTSLPPSHLAQLHLDPKYTTLALKTFKTNGNLFIMDESDNSYQIVSPFDDKLTNGDADSETDPEAAGKSEVEGEQNTRIWSSRYQAPDIQVPWELVGQVLAIDD